MDDPDVLVNLTMFMRSGSVAKMLFLDEVYRRIVHLPGIIMEFGVWLGADPAHLAPESDPPAGFEGLEVDDDSVARGEPSRRFDLQAQPRRPNVDGVGRKKPLHLPPPNRDGFGVEGDPAPAETAPLWRVHQ